MKLSGGVLAKVLDNYLSLTPKEERTAQSCAHYINNFLAKPENAMLDGRGKKLERVHLTTVRSWLHARGYCNVFKIHDNSNTIYQEPRFKNYGNHQVECGY